MNNSANPKVPLNLASCGTPNIMGWCLGERVTSLKDVEVNAILIKVSKQFDAQNLVRITRVGNDIVARDKIVYGVFCDQANEMEMRAAGDHEFAIWYFELDESSETYYRVTRAQTQSTKQRTEPDHLTLAYVALGAGNALRTAGDSLNLDEFEGQMGLISQVVGRALFLDIVADWFEAREGHAGVFVYEVAEPFGTAYTTALLKSGDAGADPAAILREIMSGCDYSQSDIEQALKDAASNPKSGVSFRH